MNSALSEAAPSLDPERWRRIGGILTAVLEYPVLQRNEALLELCEGDARLAVEVGAYLDAHERTSGWFPGATTPVPEAGPVMAPGQRIGPYEVVAELGRGGMGEVYLAERADEVYERQVAIKVVKRGMDSREIVRRFVRERRILADLDHPSIAGLLDGGTTDDDRPFFVMEYIHGQPIDEYSRQQALPIRARLELFRKVCAAVDHAHRQLVVHRDLKPANILVDSDGEPNLLDFGIAKLLAAEPGWAETQTALRPMTLKYSSPEQLRGGVTTVAVDVHALGILLYELLTERHPYILGSSTPEDLQQSICETEPLPPSRAVVQSSAPWTGSPLKGDLDAIVLKALRKDPLERYPSVASLDEDVRRHLDGEAIRAKKGSLWYRVSKFARRNRHALTVLAGVLGLVGFFVASTIRQSQEVATSAETARRTADFMVELFSLVDPSEARGQAITAREILDRGVQRIETDLVDEPKIRAELTHTMGHVYSGLGLYEPAEELLQAALSTKVEVYGEHRPEQIETLMSLSVVNRNLGQLEKAEIHARNGLELAESHYGEQHAVVARAMNVLSLALWNRGDLASAEAYSRQSLTLARALGDSTIIGPTLNNLGLVLMAQGNLEESEVAYRESLMFSGREYGRGHPSVLGAQNNLASVLIQQDKGLEAEPLFRQVIATRRQILGEDHPDLGTSLNNFAMLLHSLERYDEAEPIIREAIEIYRHSLGEEHAGVAIALHNLAVIRRSQGASKEALGLYLEAENRKRKIFGHGHTELARTLAGRANLMRELGDCASAEPLFREAIAIYQGPPPGERWRQADYRSALAECLTELDRLQEAELLLLESLAVLEDERGLRSSSFASALRRLVELYETWEQPEKAHLYRKRLEEL